MYVSENISSKLTDSYRNYEYPVSSNEYYAGKGYVASLETIVNNDYSNSGHFATIKENTFTEDSMDSLIQIIEYCEENEVELILFSAPMSQFRLVDVGNYDDYITQVNAICAEYGISYYDFNLCRESYFPNDCSLFKDNHHLNMYGAELFSEVFASFFTGEISEEDLFYDTFSEKTADAQAQVYGIIYETEKGDSVKTIKLEAVSSGDPDAYYTILKKTDGESDYEAIQTLGALSDVQVSKGESGKLKIRVYSDAEGSNMTNEVTISY